MVLSEAFFCSLAVKTSPGYMTDPYIIGCKSFSKVTAEDWNENPMMPKKFSYKEVFSQNFIIDVAPVPPNPKNESDHTVYTTWWHNVRKNSALRRRRDEVESLGIYYIYHYDIEHIIEQLILLGTKHEDNFRRQRTGQL